jgi:hypothetical protein
VIAEQHSIELPKAVAYVKSIDSQMRGPQKPATATATPGINVEELLAVHGAPGDVSWREYIADLRTNAGMTKADVVKQVYEDRKSEVDSGAIAPSTITAMVTAALKGLAAARKSEPRANTVPLGDLVLAKYDELVNKFGSAATDESKQLVGEAAAEFATWYETTRGGAVGKVERTGERMAAHAMWDLKRRLVAKGIFVKVAKAPTPKPAPAAAEQAS